MIGQRFQNPNAVPRDPNRRLGFQDVDKEVVATRGVKLKNKSAERKEKEKVEREEYKQKFDERAEKTIQHYNEQNSRAIEIISRFIKMSEDKTLAQNKGGIADDVEREIRQDLIQLALDLNNDENEEDNGKGSVIALSAMTKILLVYRDRLNELEYQLLQLKRELNAKNLSSRPARQGSNASE
jgi:hypothetical protein